MVCAVFSFCLHNTRSLMCEKKSTQARGSTIVVSRSVLAVLVCCWFVLLVVVVVTELYKVFFLPEPFASRLSQKANQPRAKTQR